MTNPTDPLVEEQTPQAARLAEIRRYAERVHPDAVAQCLPAMLRDLQAEVDRLVAAARVRRAETLCEVAELLARVDMAAAAELVQAQVLLEHADPGTGAPLGHEVYQRVLAGLASYNHPGRRT